MNEKNIKSLVSAFKFFIFFLLLMIFFSFTKGCYSSNKSETKYEGPYHLNPNKSWGYKTISTNPIHNYLSVYNIREDAKTLKFDMNCHMHMKSGGTRKCTFYYEIDKSTGKGRSICKVIGWIDNAMRLKESSISLIEWSDNKLVFTATSRPDQVDPKLVDIPQNYFSTFEVVADP